MLGGCWVFPAKKMLVSKQECSRSWPTVTEKGSNLFASQPRVALLGLLRGS